MRKDNAHDNGVSPLLFDGGKHSISLPESQYASADNLFAPSAHDLRSTI
jgi:hypothetical protein